MNSFPFKDETYSIIGHCMEVHRFLGFGFSETLYKDAMEVEFSSNGISFQREVHLQAFYKGASLQHRFFADFLLCGEIIIEVKSSEKGITDDHIAQTLNYLRISGKPVGLIINFGRRKLDYKRLIFSEIQIQLEFCVYLCSSVAKKKIISVSTFTPDTTNTLFQLASDLVNQSDRSIFLTGKAGTGKTTFLKYIREHCPKQMAIVAPTGVAAINAGGVTIHSFFQLPFAPFVPQSKPFEKNHATVDRHDLVSRLRFNNDKRKVMQQLELLVIDEISMVRCDVLDAIDTVLRYFRKKPQEPFGGVQLLLIGDMFQLPPVVKEPEWKLISGFYDSPYFFDSLALRDNPPLYIEFDKIYRQSEERFIHVLNQVRNNALDATGYAVLESRYQPVIRRTTDDGYIILTTHNEQARNINMQALQELPGKAFHYKANVDDDFPGNAFPADELLVLKEGAQVMFIRNDTGEKGKRYYNGKIGKVVRLEEEKIVVQVEDGTEIEVAKEKWENIRYTLNKQSQTLESDVLGSFTQYPLRLAWAITIHKSQGLTFDKVIIDAGEAFAPGQVYVALSRCTSLDGLILKSKVRTQNLFTDHKIVAFSQSIASSERLQKELEAARKHYQEKLLLSSFDFATAIQARQSLSSFLSANIKGFNPETTAWLDQLGMKLESLQETALKFHSWIRGQFESGLPPEQNLVLQERIKKAAAHFEQELQAITGMIRKSPAVTDSRILAKEYNDLVKELFAALAISAHLLTRMDLPFSCAGWHRQKRSFVLPACPVNAYAASSDKKTDSPHPALYKKLKEVRDNICSRKNAPVYMVAGSTSLDEMARYLPQDEEDLARITGFGEAKVRQYGRSFLDVIVEYCDEHGLYSSMDEKPGKQSKKSTASKGKKGKTQAETFRLYSEGRSVTEIAGLRMLTSQTIEGHLSNYIRSGEINVESLVSKEKIEMIEAALSGYSGSSITPVKQKLGDAVSYGEIRLVMAGKGLDPAGSTD